MAFGGLLFGLLLAAATAWWWNLGSKGPSVDARPAPNAQNAPPPTLLEPVPAAAYAPPPTIAAAPPPASPPMPAPAPAQPPPEVSPVLPPAAPAPPAAATIEPPTKAKTVPETGDTGLGPRDGDLPWSAWTGTQLPPLRVSMHVYADQPDRRFAIIDGQRRREGDGLSGGLTLLEIRRDGLRIGGQGRVLWVPR